MHKVTSMRVAELEVRHYFISRLLLLISQSANSHAVCKDAQERVEWPLGKKADLEVGETGSYLSATVRWPGGRGKSHKPC